MKREQLPELTTQIYEVYVDSIFMRYVTIEHTVITVNKTLCDDEW